MGERTRKRKPCAITPEKSCLWACLPTFAEVKTGFRIAPGGAQEFFGIRADLATYADTVLNSVPPEARVLVTAHDAFNYFGRAYSFEVIGIQGISTESEAGLNRVTGLVNLLVDRGIGSVFVESSVSDRSVRALIEGAASQGHVVRIGGELYSDAMGAPGTYEGTYIGMIDHNVTTIAFGLGGTAPQQGMTGQLNLES